MEVTQYIAKSGDRLDLIAFKAYGSLSTKFPNGLDPIGAILDANNGLLADTTLIAGTTILIPVMDDGNLVSTSLPPWLQ
jgi:phage tail protein X